VFRHGVGGDIRISYAFAFSQHADRYSFDVGNKYYYYRRHRRTRDDDVCNV